jgi:hypothetical protein
MLLISPIAAFFPPTFERQLARQSRSQTTYGSFPSTIIALPSYSP